MQILYSNSGSSWVIKPIDSLHTKHEHDGHVENEQQDHNREGAHPGTHAEVTLTVVGSGKGVRYPAIPWGSLSDTIELCLEEIER